MPGAGGTEPEFCLGRGGAAHRSGTAAALHAKLVISGHAFYFSGTHFCSLRLGRDRTESSPKQTRFIHLILSTSLSPLPRPTPHKYSWVPFTHLSILHPLIDTCLGGHQIVYLLEPGYRFSFLKNVCFRKVKLTCSSACVLWQVSRGGAKGKRRSNPSCSSILGLQHGLLSARGHPTAPHSVSLQPGCHCDGPAGLAAVLLGLCVFPGACAVEMG